MAGAFYGAGTGPIHLGGAFCYNFQSRLSECGTNGWGTPGDACAGKHTKDVGVK